MDAESLSVLELPAVVERLAAATSTPHGVELALALAPSPDPDEVARRQALTAEAIALLDEAAEPPLRGIADVRAAADRAARGGVLSPAQLGEIGAAIRGGLAAREALAEQSAPAPLLNELAAPIEPGLAQLADENAARVEPDGSDLRDTASPALRKLRRELRDGRHRVAEELRRLARGPELRQHLQENFVTQRGGRPVLAVKASARGAVAGVVHDTSGSGETLFVEPFAVVELSNRLAEAARAEREEVERILRELSSAVADRADALRELVEAAGAVDLALARGILSRGWRGAPVASTDEVRLLGARHPLLDPAAAVPIDLDLGALRALVVSGPNTGGKTVALKTLGLAALLHQSGLHPPAETAALPVFDRVLATVGDRQSIEMSLSTFSAHLRDLLAILDAATERSLVLVDELVSGTDPVEGSALAQALLTRLARQARLTAVTTHYPELKEWASATDGAANAATGFDSETHEPLYRIALGRPGTSHALEIAERLGLDADVVADARARVAPERLRVAELLAEAQSAERAAAEEREAAGVERAEAARRAEEARERESELAAAIEDVRASAERERDLALARAERELAEARAELSGLRKEIRAARLLQREARRASAPDPTTAERDRDRRLGEASAKAARAEEALRALREPVPLQGPLAPGDPVEAPDLGVRGTIAAFEGDEAEVVGATGQRIRVPVARLRADARGGPPEDELRPGVRVLAAARSDASDELDLRGRRAEEARAAIRSFVDDAALAGLALVRVVHGRGTGAVRAAVRDELGRHPLVESYETDSADGATVAHLAG
ncbi:MAG TPA: Smr/MutS family protein [Gaiellaceae bacterium]|nr:Smr/MutS family protein [Gaiellaceae bacterium]